MNVGATKLVAPIIFNGGKIIAQVIHFIQSKKVGNMEYMELEVYSQSIDRGLVKMPSQSFPGLVLQGETLATLLKLASTVHERSQNTNDSQLVDTARELTEMIQKLVVHYESTLNRHNIPLPYATVPIKPDVP